MTVSVCKCACVCVCVYFDLCGELPTQRVGKESERARDGGVTRLVLLFFRGAFANECDLDLSSWFIILRCLRSRCCCCCCCCYCSLPLLLVFVFSRLLLLLLMFLCALVCAFMLYCFCCPLLLLRLYCPLFGAKLCGFPLFRLNSFDSSAWKTRRKL